MFRGIVKEPSIELVDTLGVYTLGGLESRATKKGTVGMHFCALHFWALESLATDFGSGDALT